jgi:pyroglutamyl-peptidase
MNILITGFEPFGESQINPSQMLVEALSVSHFPQVSMITAILPVDQSSAPERLESLIRRHQPEAVLAFGLAMSRARISLERVALNLQDFGIPDNLGITIRDQPIHPDGPAAYFSTLPLRPMLEGLSHAGIPAELSLSAGSYLCNLVFYTMMHALAPLPLKVPAGFIHLPALPEQAAQVDKSIPSMSFATLQQAAQVLLKKLVESAK